MIIDLPIEYLPHYPGFPDNCEPMTYATDGSSGFDVYACIPRPVTLFVGDSVRIPLGFKAQIPVGYELQLRARSGLSTKHGMMLLNGIGTIDSDYRGELEIRMARVVHGLDNRFTIEINPFDKIGQAVLMEVPRARLLPVATVLSTERGEGGFGSTGVSTNM